jgi:hypothetical protein
MIDGDLLPRRGDIMRRKKFTGSIASAWTRAMTINFSAIWLNKSKSRRHQMMAEKAAASRNERTRTLRGLGVGPVERLRPARIQVERPPGPCSINAMA